MINEHKHFPVRFYRLPSYLKRSLCKIAILKYSPYPNHNLLKILNNQIEALFINWQTRKFPGTETSLDLIYHNIFIDYIIQIILFDPFYVLERISATCTGTLYFRQTSLRGIITADNFARLVSRLACRKISTRTIWIANKFFFLNLVYSRSIIMLYNFFYMFRIWWLIRWKVWEIFIAEVSRQISVF